MKNMKNQSKERKPFERIAKGTMKWASHKWVILLLFFLIVFALIFNGFTPQTVNLKAGDIASNSIVAPRRIVDTEMTQSLRVQAENLTSPVYDYLTNAYSETSDQVNTLFSTLDGVHSSQIDQAAVDSYNQIFSVNLSLADYQYLLSLRSSTRAKLQSAINEILSGLYAGEIKAAELQDIKSGASDQLLSYDLGAQSTQIGQSILQSVIRPNMILNEDATKIARAAARDSVSEVVYETGQTIVTRGDVVTEHQIALLKEAGLIKTGLFENMSKTFGLPALILILIAIYISYLYLYHPEIYASSKMLVLIAAQFVLMLIIGQLCIYFSVYMIQVSIMTMTLCLVFNSRVAVQTNLFLMLFLAVGLQLDIDSFLYLIISGYVGILYMQQISTRTDIFKSGMLVSGVNMLMILIINIYRSNIGFTTLTNLIYGFGNGVIAALLTSGMLMMWEAMFNIVTPFKLLEMSNPTDDVIQKLITEAPGTYQHSLVVSNMSETAAKKIGANQLLARVGAYYHDIGKSEKSVYFKENQIDITNPHDYISPEVSAKILKNHVSDGVYLAEKYRIPSEISQFIQTHHGTSEISYFKAEADQQGYEGSEDFHYHGILPHTKETSIVMLADSVEAAVRSLDEKNTDNIRKMIRSIVGKKINEGQLKESKLSFEEIETIKSAFYDVLTGVYHTRIKYPESESVKNI